MCELELEKSVKERVQVKYLMQQQKVNLKRKTVPKAEVNPVYSYQNIQPQAESNTLRKATSQQHLKVRVTNEVTRNNPLSELKARNRKHFFSRHELNESNPQIILPQLAKVNS